MRNGAGTLSQVFLKFWSKLIAAINPNKDRGVFLHDPAAERPHDLDDAIAELFDAICNCVQRKMTKCANRNRQTRDQKN